MIEVKKWQRPEVKGLGITETKMDEESKILFDWKCNACGYVETKISAQKCPRCGSNDLDFKWGTVGNGIVTQPDFSGKPVGPVTEVVPRS